MIMTNYWILGASYFQTNPYIYVLYILIRAYCTSRDPLHKSEKKTIGKITISIYIINIYIFPHFCYFILFSNMSCSWWKTWLRWIAVPVSGSSAPWSLRFLGGVSFVFGGGLGWSQPRKAGVIQFNQPWYIGKIMAWDRVAITGGAEQEEE